MKLLSPRNRLNCETLDISNWFVARGVDEVASIIDSVHHSRVNQTRPALWASTSGGAQSLIGLCECHVTLHDLKRDKP